MSKTLTLDQLRAYCRDKQKLQGMAFTLESVRMHLGTGEEVDDLTASIEAMANDLAAREGDVVATLDLIPDPWTRHGARLHFLRGMQWVEVAAAMGHATRTIETMVYRALKKAIPKS